MSLLILMEDSMSFFEVLHMVWGGGGQFLWSLARILWEWDAGCHFWFVFGALDFPWIFVAAVFGSIFSAFRGLQP